MLENSLIPFQIQKDNMVCKRECVCVLSGETEEKPTKCLQGERRYDYLVQYISHDRVMGSHRSLFLISLQSEAFGAG